MTADAIAPPTLAAALAARPTAGTATVVEAPAALRALATATLLEAVVTARDPGGLVSLRTDAGTVVLRGAAHLALGTSVSLQLPQAASGPATVTANPSERPQAAAAPTQAPLDPAPRLGGAVTVTATVLSPPPSRAPAELLADRPGRVASDASPTLPRGAYQAVAVEPPVAGARAAPASPTVATETAGAARPAGAGEAALSDQHAESFSPAAKASDIRGDFARLAQRATAATPAPGATVELRLAAPASPPSNAAERPLPATVLDRTPTGQTVLDTPIGRLAAMLPREYAAARAGTRLLFLWRPPEAAAPTPPVAAREFGALRQALGTLAESNLPAAQDAAKQMLPRPGPALARQMLEFVEAAERGARRWVGEAAAQALEKSGAGELLRQLDQSLRDAARQPAAAEWRHVVIPFADGAQLRPIDLWARRQRGRERDGKPREQSRFVVECAHEAWGEIQVDGLMTQGDDGSRLDVVLRTHAELPASLRAELAVGFADALGAMGVAGDIAFQAVAAFPPRPAPAPVHAVTA